MESNAQKTIPERQAFWEKSKRLQHGTLVLLWIETPSKDPASARGAVDVKITPCVISDRDEEQLAPRDRSKTPAIGLRYSCTHWGLSSFCVVLTLTTSHAANRSWQACICFDCCCLMSFLTIAGMDQPQPHMSCAKD